jgi:predicted phage-related endonuclease
MPDFNVTRHRFEPGEFPAERGLDLTASSGVPALFGASSYVSLFELWHHHARGVAFKERTLDQMSAGTFLEAGIAAWASQELGEPLQKVRQYYRAPDLRIGASPDYRTTRRRRPVEIKYCVHWTAWRDRWDEGRQCPLEYQIQVHTQSALMGADCGYVFVLFGADLRRFDVPFSPDVWKATVDHAAAFWQSVADGTVPDADGADPEDVFWAFARSRIANPIDLTGDNAVPGILLDWQEAEVEAKAIKAALKPVEERAKAAKAKLLGRIGDHDGAIVGKTIVAAPTVERGEYVAKATAYRSLKIEKARAASKTPALEVAQ